MAAETPAMDPETREHLIDTGHDVRRGGMDPALLGMMLPAAVSGPASRSGQPV